MDDREVSESVLGAIQTWVHGEGLPDYSRSFVESYLQHLTGREALFGQVVTAYLVLLLGAVLGLAFVNVDLPSGWRFLTGLGLIILIWRLFAYSAYKYSEARSLASRLYEAFRG